MRIILHPKQSEIAQSKARFKVVRCGRRFGKTYLAVTMLIANAMETPGKYWFIAPYYGQAKDIAWQMLSKFIPEGVIASKNETELSVELRNGSSIVLKGADNPDRLKGVGLNGCILDEYAFIKPFVWEEVIRPMLFDTQGWAMFISTPQGYNHFYRLWESTSGKADWERFYATTYDNPHITKEEIDEAKASMSEERFAQEIMADFAQFEGQIYKDFRRERNVVKSFEIPANWNRYRTIDLGVNDPTACLWIAQDADKNVYIYREYYESNRATEDHAEDICFMSSKEIYRGTIFDHHGLGKQLIIDYNRLGLKGTEHKEHRIISGITRIQELLRLNSAGKPQLFVFENCLNTIFEFENYQWDLKRQNRELNSGEKPLDYANHCLDALKNWAMTYYYTKTPTDSEIKERRERRETRKANIYKVSSLTGY